MDQEIVTEYMCLLLLDLILIIKKDTQIIITHEELEFLEEVAPLLMGILMTGI